jgi:putative transposase
MPSRRTSALHAHRWSQPDTTYFVTCCTQDRRPGLNNPVVAAVLRTLVMNLDSSHDSSTVAFTVMPDHVHWLFTLGSRLSLGRMIARWKVQSRDALAGAGLVWQRDFYEHSLRAAESLEEYGLYVFLNPYRAGLCRVRPSPTRKTSPAASITTRWTRGTCCPRCSARRTASCPACSTSWHHRQRDAARRRPRARTPAQGQRQRRHVENLRHPGRQRGAHPAEEEAKSLKDEFVSVEHLFLGLLEVGKPEALKKLFKSFGLDRARC